MRTDVAEEPISPARLRISRILTGVAAALGAAPGLADTETQHVMTQTWRLYGLLVFAGLFVLLTWRPRGYRWLWEIVIGHKVLLTLTAGYFLARGGDVQGAGTVLVADGLLTVLLLLAYVLVNGWRSR